MRRAATIIVLLAAAAAGGRAQDPTGRWRVVDDRGAGGSLLVERGPDGRLTYTRAMRTRLDAAPAVERGDGAQARDLLDLVAGQGPGLSALGLGGPAGLARARYRAQPTGGWQGVRLAGGQRTRERLDPWRAGVDGNAVKLLLDGEVYAHMRPAIDAARRSIELQTFHWSDDEVGREFAARLIAKARAGVRVRCLIDSSSKTVNDLMKKKDVTAGLDDVMRQGGVEVVVAHGYGRGVLNSLGNVGRGLWNGVKRLFGGAPAPRERRGIFNHDHRKLLVVDGRVGFIGGMNVGNEYETEWHDIVARVEGPCAYAMHRAFVDRWRAAGERATEDPPPAFDPPPGDVPAELVATIPGLDRKLLDFFLARIDGSRERCLIEVAYFLDDRIIAALGRAAGRGVRTVVIVPSDEKNDVYLVKEAFAWVQNDVVRSGVELYKYRERLNHGKVGTWDGRISTVGSCNLDRLALDEVSEANIVVPDPRFARVLEERVFAVDLPKSDRVTVQPLPFKRKLTAGTLHAFRSFL